VIGVAMLAAFALGMAALAEGGWPPVAAGLALEIVWVSCVCMREETLRRRWVYRTASDERLIELDTEEIAALKEMIAREHWPVENWP
jgi:hypothetical protein